MTISEQDFKTLQEAFLLRGHTLSRTSKKDGAMVYYATRWGLTKELHTIEELRRFLAQIGGAE